MSEARKEQQETKRRPGRPRKTPDPDPQAIPIVSATSTHDAVHLTLDKNVLLGLACDAGEVMPPRQLLLNLRRHLIGAGVTIEKLLGIYKPKR